MLEAGKCGITVNYQIYDLNLDINIVNILLAKAPTCLHFNQIISLKILLLTKVVCFNLTAKSFQHFTTIKLTDTILGLVKWSRLEQCTNEKVQEKKNKQRLNPNQYRGQSS